MIDAHIYNEIEASLARPERLAALVDAVDRLDADPNALLPEGMARILAALHDDISNIEVVDALLGRLEADARWVSALAGVAETMARRAPNIFRGRLARVLNDPASQSQLAELLTSLEVPDAEAILCVARELAKKPGARPGDSARAFLVRVSDEAEVTLRTMEGDQTPDLPQRVGVALRRLVRCIRPDEPLDTTSEEWHPFEHSVWRLFARMQECLRERKDLRGRGPVLDAIAELCLDQSLGRGRQLGVLLLGERGAGRYDDVLNRLLHDADVYGHALDSLAKSSDRSQRRRVEQILESEKHGWIRRAAKKYLTGTETAKR